MIMSATMPEALRSTLRKYLTPSMSIVEESTLLNSARNYWETHGTPLSQWVLVIPHLVVVNALSTLEGSSA